MSRFTPDEERGKSSTQPEAPLTPAEKLLRHRTVITPEIDFLLKELLGDYKKNTNTSMVEKQFTFSHRDKDRWEKGCVDRERKPVTAAVQTLSDLLKRSSVDFGYERVECNEAPGVTSYDCRFTLDPSQLRFENSLTTAVIGIRMNAEIKKFKEGGGKFDEDIQSDIIQRVRGKLKNDLAEIASAQGNGRIYS